MIRHGMDEGEFDNWGRATHGVAVTGPLAVLGVQHDLATQFAWLERQQAAYLMTYPSLLAELLNFTLATGRRLAGLREVRAFGETVTPELRAACREVWGVRLVDVYSSTETGYMALQCPDHDHYHVQSEDVLVEVLDDQGKPCAPGEVGRVVVTDRKSTRLNSSHIPLSRMPSSA